MNAAEVIWREGEKEDEIHRKWMDSFGKMEENLWRLDLEKMTKPGSVALLPIK